MRAYKYYCKLEEIPMKYKLDLFFIFHKLKSLTEVEQQMFCKEFNLDLTNLKAEIKREINMQW